jgi:uncharacterized protein YndB with AHSA1/START domain
MIWIVYLLGGLAALVALMALIGLTLRADHVSTRDATIAAPPAAVFAAIRDVAAYPSWRRDVKKVEVLPPIDGKPAFKEHGSNGAIPFVIDEDVAPSRLVTRIADDKLPFGGRWIITVSPDGAGSRVTVTEEGVVKNPVFRFLSRTVFSLSRTQEVWLRNLAAHFATVRA